MEEKIRELLKKISTQLDGVEGLCKELHDLGESNREDNQWVRSDLTRQIRVQTEFMQETELKFIREDLQKIEDALNKTTYFPDKK